MYISLLGVLGLLLEQLILLTHFPYVSVQSDPAPQQFQNQNKPSAMLPTKASGVISQHRVCYKGSSVTAACK